MSTEFSIRPDSPSGLFEAARVEARSVFRHSFVPLRPRAYLLPALEKATLLPDQRFAAVTQEHSFYTPMRDDKKAGIVGNLDQAISTMNVVSLPEAAGEGMVVREGFFSDDTGRSFATELLFEGLALHPRIKRDIELRDVLDGSAVILPYGKTRAKVADFVRRVSSEFYGVEDVKVSDIVAHIRGFNTFLSVRQDGGESIRIPQLMKGLAFEKARTTAIQMLLEVLMYGMRAEPEASPIDQATAGMYKLVHEMRTSAAYLPEQAMELFVRSFLKDYHPDIQAGFHALFDELTTYDLDDFFTVGSRAHEFFEGVRAIDAINNEIYPAVNLSEHE